MPASPRLKAAILHLAASLVVAGIVFLAVFFVWYPEPFFRGAGGRHLFLTLAAVNVAIGPLCTLLVYKPGKPGLRFDLAVIGTLQVAALAYGAHVVYDARPAWIVFVKDRFELVRANALVEPSRARARAPFAAAPVSGPRVVGARQSEDADERLQIMITALQGVDVSSYPHLYVDYESVSREAAAKSRPAAALREFNPGRGAEIDRALRRSGLAEGDVGYLPLRAGRVDFTVLLEARTGRYLGAVDLRPWTY